GGGKGGGGGEGGAEGGGGGEGGGGRPGPGAGPGAPASPEPGRGGPAAPGGACGSAPPASEACGSAASAATSGFGRPAACRTYVAFADACRGAPDGAAPHPSCRPGEPYAAEAGITASGSALQLGAEPVEHESCPTPPWPWRGLDRFERIVEGVRH